MNPERTRAWQEAALRHRAAKDMVKNSALQRGRLERVELKPAELGSMRALGRLAPMTFPDVRAVGDLLSTPWGSPSKRHSPVAWTFDTPVPLAYSHTDLATLAKCGKQMMEMIGVRPGDLVLNLVAPANFRDHQQVTMGALRAQVGQVAVDPTRLPEEVDRLAFLEPSVIAGDIATVTDVLDAAYALHRLHTVLLVGPQPSPARMERLAEAAERVGAGVVRMYGPGGALAAWAQCRGGNGLHTWPQEEIIELVDPVSLLPVPEGRPGLLLWTGIGWHCTTMLRMQLPVFGRLLTGTCDACGRHAARIVEESRITSFSDVLDATEGIETWFAELRGGAEVDELVIFVAMGDEANGLGVLSSLAEQLGNYVRIEISDVERVTRMIEDASGERYGDRRAFPA